MCYVLHLPKATMAAASLQASSNLSEAEVRALAEGMASAPGTWEAECQESYDGDRTLVITSATPASDLSFAVWRSGAGLQLAVVRNDDPEETQLLASIEAVLLAIHDRLARSGMVSSPAPGVIFRPAFPGGLGSGRSAPAAVVDQDWAGDQRRGPARRPPSEGG